MKPIPYGRQSIDDSDVAAVVEQLKADWLTQGPTIARFEDSLCELTGARFAVAVSNGTAALHLACMAANLGPGDVALVPDVTFVATANAVRYCGATPVLVDVDPATALVQPAALLAAASARAAAGERVRAILPVSFAGSVPQLAEIRAIASHSDALVIEDAAHSLGATYTHEGRAVPSASCTHSDMAILSFHPVKHITTCEGGAITTNDAALAKRLRLLRSHGITKDAADFQIKDEGPWYMEQQDLGYNYRITDVQCALGLSQARRFPEFLRRRREIARRYDAAFSTSTAIQALPIPSGVTSAYHLYVVRLVAGPAESNAALAKRRLAFFLGLRERAVLPQVHYIPVHRQPDFRRAGLSGGDFAGADAYYASCVSLPMFPGLTDADVDAVISAVIDAAGAGQTPR